MLAPATTETDVPPSAPEVDPPKLLALPKHDHRTHSLQNTNEETVLARAEQVYAKRLEGKSYETIGKELGVSTATAHRDAKMIARMKYAGLIEKDELVLMEQNHTIDKLMEKWLPVALEDFSVGETRQNRRGEEYDITLKEWESSSIATDKIMKLMEHKAKINGVIAPSGSNKANDRTPEEIGTSVAISVFAAFEKMYNKPKEIDIEVVKIT